MYVDTWEETIMTIVWSAQNLEDFYVFDFHGLLLLLEEFFVIYMPDM